MYAHLANNVLNNIYKAIHFNEIEGRVKKLSKLFPFFFPLSVKSMKSFPKQHDFTLMFANLIELKCERENDDGYRGINL